MDRQLIREKLESLRRCLARVQTKTPDSAAALAADPDLQDILVLNLSRAVQLAVDVASHLLSTRGSPPPATMGAAFRALGDAGVLAEETAAALARAVGFRNIAVHNYEEIDWEIVFAICSRGVEDFRAFAAAVTREASL